MHVCFDVMQPYYLSQYLPVATELLRRGAKLEFLCHRVDDEFKAGVEQELNGIGAPPIWVNGLRDVIAHCNRVRPDWLVFGNTEQGFTGLAPGIKTALMQHGIGPKACYFDMPKEAVNVRFVEGPERLARLQALYPDTTFVDSGFAKLDPVVNGHFGQAMALTKLDPNKPTLLYAPTFFPSSIEALPLDWPEWFEDCNIILKPHYFSLSKPKYRKQKSRLAQWAQYPHVTLAPMEAQNIAPYMACADVLLSDASSTLLEFVALDKPVVWCDFFHLRWSYRGPLRFRLKDRLDSNMAQYKYMASVASSPGALPAQVRQALYQPALKAAERKRFTQEHVGKVDGQCSARIADYLYAAE